MFDDGKDQVLFDAHMTRPSLMKYVFGSVPTDAGVVEEKLRLHHVDRLRAIFVSHSHHDHVMDAPFIVAKCGCMFYGSRSALNVARGGDIPEEKLVGFEAGRTYEVGDYRITVIPSLHSKPTILNNDLGETIDAPLRQPARLRSYKESGSYDFFIEVQGKSIMIRPSVKPHTPEGACFLLPPFLWRFPFRGIGLPLHHTAITQLPAAYAASTA